MALKLLVLTGKRLSEVAAAKKSELRLEGSDPRWAIGNDRMKSDDEHTVPLAPMALALFRHACGLSGDSEYVFPARPGAKVYGHIDPLAVTRQRARIIASLGIVGPTTHDLRTTISVAARHMNVATDVRRGLLSHKAKPDDLVDSVYGVGDPWHERRAALEAWEARLVAIVAG